MRKGRCAYGRDGSVTAYLDGALHAEGRRGFEEHLRRCTTCHGVLRDTLWLIRHLPLAGPDSMPFSTKQPLLEAMRRRVTAGRA